MKLYRISKCDFINDLSGHGASMFGGRWNSKGVFVLYTAQSPSLALLETVAHITNLASSSYCMICLEVPDTSLTIYEAEDLSEDWQSSPPPASLRQVGDRFIEANESLTLKIPSAIMPEENNFLINPAHADFKKIRIVFVKPLPIDSRLVKS